MKLLRLYLYIILLLPLVLAWAFILPLPGFEPVPGIIVGTLVFLVVAGLAIIIVGRKERQRTKAVNTELKYLRAFQRWFNRIRFGVDEQYLKLKYNKQSGLKCAYLEDFRRIDLKHIRYDLPGGYRLSDFGQIDRIDRGDISLKEILYSLRKRGWHVYYVRHATPDQLFTVQHLWRETEISA